MSKAFEYARAERQRQMEAERDYDPDFGEAAFAWMTTHNEWFYADREPAWRWFFEQGRSNARKACAKTCDDIGAIYQSEVAVKCARAIRARAQEQT